MSIRLAPETEDLIRAKLASGDYATADEVVVAAIRLLDAHDQQVAGLSAKLQTGLDQIQALSDHEGSRMDVKLTPQLQAMIQEKVDSGRFLNATDVIEEALRLLDARERRVERIRASVAAGLAAIERGEGIELTPELMDEIDREAEALARRGEQPNPDVCP